MMDKKLNFVKSLKEQLSCDVIVTGSTALFLYGVVEEDGQDLDIIVMEPSDDDLKVLERTQKVAPRIIGVVSDYNDLMADYQFSTSFGFDVDVFIEIGIQKIGHNFMTLDGITLNPVSRILGAKSALNRKKDQAFAIKLISRVSTLFLPSNK